MLHKVSPDSQWLPPLSPVSSGIPPAPPAPSSPDGPEGLTMEQDLAMYKKFFTVSRDMICIASLDGYFRKINPAFERVLGYTEAEIKQNSFLDLIHPDDVARTLNEIAALKDQVASPSFTNRYRRKDGTYRWLTWYSQPIEGSTLVYASARDVTDRVEAREELVRSEEKFRLLAEHMADVVILHQIDATVDYVSPSVRKVLGYAPEELMGTNPYDVLIHADDATGIREGIHRELLTSEGQTRTVEFRVRRKDRSYIWFETTFRAVRDDQQRAVAIVTSSRDISDRKKEEERARQFEQSLLASNEELENFAYVASHDLQEPLRVISSYLQVLQRRYQDQLDEQAGQFIHYAVDGASRMKRLITDLLAYSRINSLCQEQRAIDLNEVLAQIQEDLQLLIVRTGTTLRYASLPTIRADETLVYRVFLNLISNAIKFRAERPPLVDIIAEPQEEGWQFSVSDNGIGIEAEYVDTVFDIFTRLNGHKYEGTGMGLSIVRKVVENYRGTLGLRSSVGRGTTVYFTLPQPTP